MFFSYHEKLKFIFIAGYHLVKGFIVRDFIFFLELKFKILKKGKGKEERQCPEGLLVFIQIFIKNPWNSWDSI